MIIFGGINVVEQQELTKMPQEAVTAWNAIKELVGAKYKPVMYIGDGVVNGTNYVFTAEQTLMTSTPERHIVDIKVNIRDDKVEHLTIERRY